MHNRCPKNVPRDWHLVPDQVTAWKITDFFATFLNRFLHHVCITGTRIQLNSLAALSLSSSLDFSIVNPYPFVRYFRRGHSSSPLLSPLLVSSTCFTHSSFSLPPYQLTRVWCTVIQFDILFLTGKKVTLQQVASSLSFPHSPVKCMHRIKKEKKKKRRLEWGILLSSCQLQSLTRQNKLLQRNMNDTLCLLNQFTCAIGMSVHFLFLFLFLFSISLSLPLES